MNLISIKNRNIIRKYLTETLGTVSRALDQLYPDKRLRIGDGRRRLYLLYLPQTRSDPWTAKGAGKEFPIPGGDAWYEWVFLEGEIAEVPWDEFARNKVGHLFPPRTPPFPVLRWVELPSIVYKQYPRIEVREFPSTQLSGFDREIAIGAWLLFINDVPFDMWNDLLITLMEHSIRLKLMSNTATEMQELEQLQAGLKLKKEGLLFLHSLFYVLPEIGVKHGYQLRRQADDLCSAIKYDRTFDKRVHKYMSDRQTESKKRWRRLLGPTKEYEKDAARFLKPTVADLVFEIESGLERHITAWMDQDPWWLQYEPMERGRDGLRVSKKHIYCLVGDLIRFFFPWSNYECLGLGIQKPAWRGDQIWKDVSTADEQKLAEHGREARHNFGKRIQAIHRGKTDRVTRN